MTTQIPQNRRPAYFHCLVFVVCAIPACIGTESGNPLDVDGGIHPVDSGSRDSSAMADVSTRFDATNNADGMPFDVPGGGDAGPADATADTGYDAAGDAAADAEYDAAGDAATDAISDGAIDATFDVGALDGSDVE